jgi:biotin carboxyl carrier protein
MREHLRVSGEMHELEVSERGGVVTITVDGECHEIADLKREGPEIVFRLGDRTYRFLAHTDRKRVIVWRQGQVRSCERVESLDEAEAEEAGEASLTSQMPGTVLKLLLEPGAEVAAGEPLLILEAMKMEHEICAPSEGKLVGYPFSEGDRVMPGDMLVDFEAAE